MGYQQGLIYYHQCNALRHAPFTLKDGSGNKYINSFGIEYYCNYICNTNQKNMKQVTQEILSEKMSKNPDPLYVRTLQRLQDKGEMTQDDFVKTGRITTIERFKQKVYPSTLRPDCTDVILYIGNFYIQILKDGNFFLEIGDIDNPSDRGYTKMESKDLELIESILWTKYANYKFN